MAKPGAVFGWLGSNFIFTPGALFSWGLVISHNLVDYACVSIIMLFYTEVDKKKHLAVAAILVSLQEGFTSFAAILLARIKDTHKGRFYAILISTSCYITGLTILWSYARRNSGNLHIPQYLLSSFLLAVGKGGTNPLLKSFLSDQLIQKNNGLNQNEEEEKRLLVCINVWWQSGRYGGAVVAIFAFLGDKWQTIFAVALIIMGASLSFFFCGFIRYSRRREQNNHNERVQFTHISQSNHEQQEMNANVYEVRNKNIKYLILILTCTGYSLVLATGRTLFEAQGDLMEDLQINSKKVQFSLFILIETFISHITILTFWLLGAKRQQVILVRIGAGMVCAVISCIIAWKVEVERQSNLQLSKLWMSPQFVLLGLVEGLAQSGLEKLFENESFRNLWGQSKEILSCFGNFLNILCVLIFKSWFKNFRRDHSHLERYYIMLAILSSVFLCIYVTVAAAYAKTTPENMEENRSATEDNASA